MKEERQALHFCPKECLPLRSSAIEHYIEVENFSRCSLAFLRFAATIGSSTFSGNIGDGEGRGKREEQESERERGRREARERERERESDPDEWRESERCERGGSRREAGERGRERPRASAGFVVELHLPGTLL